MASLDPVRGHEQAGYRPFLILSVDDYNRGRSDLVIGVPLTSRHRPIPTRVPIAPPEAGLRLPSQILCDAIGSIARERLGDRLGRVGPETMREVEHRLRMLVGL